MRYIIFSVILMCLAPLSVRAGESTVSLRRIHIQYPHEPIQSTTFTVQNNATVSQTYTLTFEGVAPLTANLARISPETFTLTPGDTQTVTLHIRIPGVSSHGMLSIVSYEKNSPTSVSIGSGIHIPVDITQQIIPLADAQPTPFTSYVYALDILLASLILGYWMRKKIYINHTQRI